MSKAMAVDAFIYFLKVEGAAGTVGIPGTSTFKGHEGAFEIKDFSFGVENPTTIGSATGGAGAGKIKFNEFTIKKTSDQASPTFFKNCCVGTHYNKVELTLARRAGDRANDFLKLTLKDALISRYQQVKPPPQPDPDPVDVASLVNADTIGLPSATPGPDDDLTDNVGFNFANATMVSDPVTVKVGPAATGVFAFDTKTGDWTLTEGGEGGLTVGTDGGVVHRAVQKFDVADLKGLLSLNAGSLNFTVNELRSDEGPEESPPDPNLHFDVILFQTDDSSLGPVDLKQEGTRIGSLHVDPRGDPASLDIDITDVVLDRVLIGLRLELRGAPIDVVVSNPNEGALSADQAAAGDVVLKGRNILINFTTALSFNTA